MVAYAMVKMHIDAYNRKPLWYKNVSYDDSTMSSCLKHSYEKYDTNLIDSKIDKWHQKDTKKDNENYYYLCNLLKFLSRKQIVISNLLYPEQFDGKLPR